ncbi:ester cyclase [Dyadobacter bucti]|uniref:ester cyclase n=1 Tax=Dyadobacter bucti TaxID=2572203 RepID=UPI003F70DAAF
MRQKENTLLYKWFNQVWNAKNEAAIPQLMTDNAEFQGIDDSLPKGAPGFQAFYKIFTAQYHDIRIDVEDVVSEDDMESARTVIYATHTETQKPVVVPGLCMIRVESGKIAEAWNSYDFASVDEQIGKKKAAS